MSYRRVCDEIEAAWDTISEKWIAEAKTNYYSKIYLSLLSEADGMYQRNDDLETYAKQCTASVNGYGGLD